MVDTPIWFESWIRPMVWGGQRLFQVLNKPLPQETQQETQQCSHGTGSNGPDCYGESWEVSDHPQHPSVIARGPWAGKTLRQILNRGTSTVRSFLGPGFVKGAPFPWLIKFLDASDWLSVQVHPDEEAVERLWPGEGPKTEAWFVLAADPGARIYAGLQPGVGETELRQFLTNRTNNTPQKDTKDTPVADYLHSFTPRQGDCVFLPAGTIHAVGGGVLIAEVQQTSDATFRLYDWDRRDSQGNARTLHIEQGLACVNWNTGPIHPVRAYGYPESEPRPVYYPSVRQRLVECNAFTLEYVRQDGEFPLGGTGRLQALIGLHGQTLLQGPAESLGDTRLGTGDVVLLPASMPSFTCRPASQDSSAVGLLVVSLPTDGLQAQNVLGRYGLAA